MLTPEKRKQMDAIVSGQSTPQSFTQSPVQQPTTGTLTPQKRAQMDAIVKGQSKHQKQPGLLDKAFNTAMDVLNIPSYAIGGISKGRREAVKQGDYKKVLGFGDPISDVKNAISGIKNRTSVMNELPTAYGVDPNSAPGMAMGFAGELLTPGIDVTPVVTGGAKLFGKAIGLNKAGNVFADAGRTLIEKSYKLPDSSINKIGEAIGAKNKAGQAVKVIDYLENLGMTGATRSSLAKLNTVIEPVQQAYDAMVKTGNPVDKKIYIQALKDTAAKLLSESGDPATRSIAAQLKEEAKYWEKFKGAFTDEFLAETKSKAFANSSREAINNPNVASLNEQIGRSGVNALETVAPGSQKTGTELRGMYTALEEVGKKANTGLGTQLVNALKPSALGFGIGAGYGAYKGENPLMSGLIGSSVGIAANNPAVMNKAGKLLQGNLPTNQATKLFSKAGKNLFNTGIRAPGFMRPPQSEKTPERTQKPQSYNPIVAGKDQLLSFLKEYERLLQDPTSDVAKLNKELYDPAMVGGLVGSVEPITRASELIKAANIAQSSGNVAERMKAIDAIKKEALEQLTDDELVRVKDFADDAVIKKIHQRLLEQVRGVKESLGQSVDDMKNLFSNRGKSNAQSTLGDTPLYHGSADRFTEFDPKKMGAGVGWNDQGAGVYLTESKEGANMFSNVALRNKTGNYTTKQLGEVMQVNLKPGTKILDFDNFTPDPAQARRWLKEIGLREDTIKSIPESELSNIEDLSRWLRQKGNRSAITDPYRFIAEKLGYDGIRITDPRFSSFANEPGGWLAEYGAKPESIKTVVVFDPKKTKIISSNVAQAPKSDIPNKTRLFRR